MLTWLMAQACSKKGIYYYIAPSYVMAKSIAWRLLKELGGDHFVNKNESELFVEFENGSVIQLKGAENRDSLRGVSLAGAVYRDWETDRKSTRLNSSHSAKSRMPSSA